MEDESIRKYTKITNDLKAQIIGALMCGVGVCQIARDTGISKAAVSKIKTELENKDPELIPENCQEKIEDLLIVSLKENLKGIEAIAKLAQEIQYIRQQSAGQLADLHKQLADWSIQLLQAANNQTD